MQMGSNIKELLCTRISIGERTCVPTKANREQKQKFITIL